MNRIKCLRKQANLSQLLFGKIFHVDQTAVSNWENEKNNIDIDVTVQIADYFKVPIEFVLGKAFSLRVPKEFWFEDQLEDLIEADKKGYSDYVLFKHGKGYFPNFEINEMETYNNMYRR